MDKTKLIAGRTERRGIVICITFAEDEYRCSGDLLYWMHAVLTVSPTVRALTSQSSRTSNTLPTLQFPLNTTRSARLGRVAL